MDLEEKNILIKQYINNIVNQLNEQYPEIVDEDTLNRAYEMFINREEDYESLINEINQLIYKIIINYKKSKEIQMQRHYELNDFFDCRISNETLHIHVVPKSIKEDIKKIGLKEYYKFIDEKLKDALGKIPEILLDSRNSDVKTIFAVSSLLRTSSAQEIFKKYGFEVKQATDEKFVEMFNTERIGQASISKDKFIKLYGDIEKLNIKGELINLFLDKYNDLNPNKQMSKEEFIEKISKNNSYDDIQNLILIYFDMKKYYNDEEKDKIIEQFIKIGDTRIKTEDDVTAVYQDIKFDVIKSEMENRISENNISRGLNSEGNRYEIIPANPELGFNYPFIIFIPNGVNINSLSLSNLIFHSCNTPFGMIDYNKSIDFTIANQLGGRNNLQMELAINTKMPLIMPIIPRFPGYNPEYVFNGKNNVTIESFKKMQESLDEKYKMPSEQIAYEYSKSQNILHQQMKMIDYAISHLRKMGIPMDDNIIVEGHSAGSKNATSLINEYSNRIAGYIIGGTTGQVRVNDETIPGVVYNGELDETNPMNFKNVNGQILAAYPEMHTNEEAKMFKEHYDRQYEQWKKENLNKNPKEFNIVRYDIEKQHKSYFNESNKDKHIESHLVIGYGHNASDSPEVKEASISKIIKINKERNKVKSDIQKIDTTPTITKQRKSEKELKKTSKIKMTSKETKYHQTIKQVQKAKINKKKEQTKANVKKYINPNATNNGFINIIFASIIVVLIVIVIFLFIK